MQTRHVWKCSLPARQVFPAGRYSAQEHFPHETVTLHFFVEGPARQLQFMEHRFDIALVSAQRGAQALGLEGFLLSRQRLSGRFGVGFHVWPGQAQSLAFGSVGQFAHIAGPVMAQQLAQPDRTDHRGFTAHALCRRTGKMVKQQRNVFTSFTQRRQMQFGTLSR